MLTVIVSVFNEELALREFYDAVVKVLSQTAELIFVNDGSTDRSREILKEFADADERVRVINFSRNFGHEAAMLAGIDYAGGDYMICMDADLQHPVECIPRMEERFSEGYDVVNMVRTKNRNAGFLKNLTSNAFYNVINLLSETRMEKNASDFFGISRRVAEILKSDYREKVRFIRGYVQNVGFRRTTIPYEAADRVAGKSKYTLRKLFRMSMNTIMCFSDAPLKLGIYVGAAALLMGFVMMVYTIITWIIRGAPSGYATIIVLLCFMFGALFIMVGIIGEYISVIFAEIKDRPIYIVEEKYGFTGENVDR